MVIALVLSAAILATLIIARPSIPFVTGGRVLDKRLEVLANDAGLGDAPPGAITLSSGRNIGCGLNNTDGTNVWRQFRVDKGDIDMVSYYHGKLTRSGWEFKEEKLEPDYINRRYTKPFGEWMGHVYLSFGRDTGEEFDTLEIHAEPEPSCPSWEV